TPPAAPQPRVLPSHYSPPPSFTAPAPTEIYTLSLHDALPIYRTFRENAAFFAGSGGNRSILGTLSLVGWVRTWSQASYYYDLVQDRKSTRLNSSHVSISYAVFCLKKKSRHKTPRTRISQPTGR